MRPSSGEIRVLQQVSGRRRDRQDESRSIHDEEREQDRSQVAQPAH